MTDSSMRIDRLYLRDTGPFREFDLELRPREKPDKADLHIIVGPNGCGKSTLLQAIACLLIPSSDIARRFKALNACVALKCQQWSAAISIPPVPASQTLPPQTPLNMEPGESWELGGQVYISSMGPPQKHDLHRISTQWSVPHPRPQPLTFAAFAYSGLRHVDRFELQGILEQETPPLQGALSFENPAGTQQFVQWLANSFARSALAQQDGDAAEAERQRAPIKRIEAALTSVMGDGVGFSLQRNPLRVTLKQQGAHVPLDLLPDGVKSMLSWLGDLVMRLDRVQWVNDTPLLERSFLLLLDEIDVHLHPSWQRKVLPMVQGLFPNAQIICTTHSPFVVASVFDAWVYRLSLKSGVAALAEVLPSQAGSSYSEVLHEAFGIDNEFDVDTEAQLTRFRQLRDAVLAGAHDRFDELKALAVEIGQRGVEVRDLVAVDVMQVARRIDRAA